MAWHVIKRIARNFVFSSKNFIRHHIFTKKYNPNADNIENVFSSVFLEYFLHIKSITSERRDYRFYSKAKVFAKSTYPATLSRVAFSRKSSARNFRANLPRTFARSPPFQFVLQIQHTRGEPAGDESVATYNVPEIRSVLRSTTTAAAATPSHAYSRLALWRGALYDCAYAYTRVNPDPCLGPKPHALLI